VNFLGSKCFSSLTVFSRRPLRRSSCFLSLIGVHLLQKNLHRFDAPRTGSGKHLAIARLQRGSGSQARMIPTSAETRQKPPMIELVGLQGVQIPPATTVASIPGASACCYRLRCSTWEATSIQIDEKQRRARGRWRPPPISIFRLCEDVWRAVMLSLLKGDFLAPPRE